MNTIATPSFTALRSTPGPAASTSGGPAGPLADRQRDFSSILAQSRPTPGDSPQQEARRAAEEFVSVSLIQPVLAQLRQSSHAAPPFAPGQGEKQFRSLMDAQVARQIAHASRFPIVDRLARDMLNTSRGKPAAPASTTPRPEAPSMETITREPYPPSHDFPARAARPARR